MYLSSKPDLIARLRRGKSTREAFVESHLAKTTASQIRAIRDRLEWSQQELADKVGMTQNAISRLESLHYGKATLTTLKRIAAAFDVALIVRFVPFSELVDWVSATPRVSKGLTTEAMAVPTFSMEEELGTLQEIQFASDSAALSATMNASEQSTNLLSSLGALDRRKVAAAPLNLKTGSPGGAKK